MFRLIANYAHPEDPEAFLRHYREVHSQLAKDMPNLRSFEWGVCESADGSAPPHFVTAICDWDTKEEALASLASPQGEKGSADMANFAQAGVEIDFIEPTKVI